ncbi:MAG: hypothetical protein KF856_03670 [Cyclobacteriaceae bacterium]|nr:hypothetical protein [Cyclobacteriaceae bacterium]
MIYYECHADRAFLEGLGFGSSELNKNHRFGRSRVLATVQEKVNSDALIDEDPFKGRDDFLKKLLKECVIYQDNALIYCKDKNENKIIILRPDLENFVLVVAKDLRVDLLKEFKLPKNFDDLHDLLRVEKNSNARLRFSDFIGKASDHPSIKKIKEIFKK